MLLNSTMKFGSSISHRFARRVKAPSFARVSRRMKATKVEDPKFRVLEIKHDLMGTPAKTRIGIPVHEKDSLLLIEPAGAFSRYERFKNLTTDVFSNPEHESLHKYSALLMSTLLRDDMRDDAFERACALTFQVGKIVDDKVEQKVGLELFYLYVDKILSVLSNPDSPPHDLQQDVDLNFEEIEPVRELGRALNKLDEKPRRHYLKELGKFLLDVNQLEVLTYEVARGEGDLFLNVPDLDTYDSIRKRTLGLIPHAKFIRSAFENMNFSSELRLPYDLSFDPVIKALYLKNDDVSLPNELAQTVDDDLLRHTDFSKPISSMDPQILGQLPLNANVIRSYEEDVSIQEARNRNFLDSLGQMIKIEEKARTVDLTKVCDSNLRVLKSLYGWVPGNDLLAFCGGYVPDPPEVTQGVYDLFLRGDAYRFEDPRFSVTDPLNVDECKELLLRQDV